MDSKRFASILIGSGLLWIIIMLGFFPIKLPLFLYRMIFSIPFIGIILFGFYSLFYLIYKVINLKDCPQAQIELQREIERIRHDSRYRSLFRTTTR